MRAVLRRLGFAEEGVLRGFMPDAAPDGFRHDYVILEPIPVGRDPGMGSEVRPRC